MYSAGKPSPVVIGFFSNFTSSGEAFFRNLTRLHIPKGESGSCVAVSTYTQRVGWFTAFDLPEISYLLRKGKRSLKDASSSSRKFLEIKSWMIVEKTSMITWLLMIFFIQTRQSEAFPLHGDCTASHLPRWSSRLRRCIGGVPCPPWPLIDMLDCEIWVWHNGQGF